MSLTPPVPELPESAESGAEPSVAGDAHVGPPAEATVVRSSTTGVPAEEGLRFGLPGLPVSRNHPFYLGLVGAFGVLVALGIAEVLASLASVLTLMAAALFIALGLDPLVQVLQRRGLSRGGAVAVVFLGVLLVFVGFIASVVPPLITQGTELINQLPLLVERLGGLRFLRDLDEEYGIISNLSDKLQDSGTVFDIFGGVLGAGVAVVSGVFSAFTVLVLTLYFLASLRSMTEAAYRLVPSSRRDRVRLLSDEIIRRVGGYVAGQVGVATINGVLTYILVTILGLPYGLVLAITVALFGLIPLIGATIGALVVILVALFDSLTTGIIVTVYYVIYQQVENYYIAPRIMSRTVAVPGAVAVIAALAGGTLLGVLGALIAIPIAAGVLLIVKEVVEPRMDRH
jgi:predicted PurR-regulated permease PerM